MSMLLNDCNIGDSNTFANCAQLAGHVNIQNNVILGGQWCSSIL